MNEEQFRSGGAKKEQYQYESGWEPPTTKNSEKPKSWLKDDSVNHPSHYNSHPSGVECITVVEHMTFNVGNAIKYLWRAGLKTAPEPDMCATEVINRVSEQHLEDLKKARWYIDREIQRLTGQNQGGNR